MAFGINDPVVGVAEKKDKLDIFGANDKVVPLLEKKEKKPPASIQTEAALGSTFDAEMGGAMPAEEPVIGKDVLPPKNVTNWKDIIKPENMKVIREYGEARFGESGKQRKNESDEDYAKRWMSSMRQVEWNTTLNAVPELNWIYNAKKEDVLKAAKAHELYESVPDWYESGGQPGVRPFVEAAFSAITEPTNLAGFGIGAAARYKAARTGIQQAIKTRIKAAGAGAAAEFALGTAESAVQQQREVELTKTSDMFALDKALEEGRITFEDYDMLSEVVQRRTVDKTQAVLSGAFNSVFGAIEAGSAFRKPKITTKEDLDQILKSRKSGVSDTDPATKSLVETFDKDMEETLSKFDIFEGRKILDEQSPQTALTQAEVRKDINRKAIDVAKYVMILDPSFRPKANQKVSDAVKDLFMSVDAVDDVTLDAALKKANLTPSEFAQATRTTVADAASIMQGYSSLARVLKRVSEIDPEAQKIVDAMYGRDMDVTSAMGMFGSAVKRLERESKALVVSSIGTTVRNVMGTSIGLTFEAASRILEGTIYSAGKAVKAVSARKYEKGDLTRGLQTVVRDAFGTMTYLTNAGITAEVTEKILANNPRIHQQLFHALQETGEQDLSKVARMANTFNVAQDLFFRRAVFTASIERQMRRVGMDMYQTLADGKNIPADIIKNAADDALKATFSYMPKPHKAGQRTMEAQAEGLANQFVRFFESIPGGSLLVTFPRFMTNAMAFQYKYSPIGATSGMGDMLKASAKFASNSPDAERFMRQGVEKFSKGAIGTAALYAAYKYRMENQNTEWYNVQGEDGSTVDVRAIFPIGPYLAVGDFIAKMKLGKESDAKVSEVVAAVAGMKMPAGVPNTILDSIPEIMAGVEGKEMDKLKVAVGKIIGDFAGRFIQPGQPIFAFFDQFDRESQVARDPNVIEGDNLVSEAAMNRIMNKLPELKEDLPEAKRYLRQETPVRAGEFFNILTGVRATPRVNRIEEEFKKLSLDPYTFYGASGDKVYDRTVIENSVPHIERFVGQLLDSQSYDKMTDRQKKLAMSERMGVALQVGRGITQAKMTATDRERIDKMTFNKLTERERNAINELYSQENNGRTLVEDKAYRRVYEYQAKVARFR